MEDDEALGDVTCMGLGRRGEEPAKGSSVRRSRSSTRLSAIRTTVW